MADEARPDVRPVVAALAEAMGQDLTIADLDSLHGGGIVYSAPSPGAVGTAAPPTPTLDVVPVGALDVATVSAGGETVPGQAVPSGPADSDDVAQETLDDEPRSIVVGLLKQLRFGMDLSRVTLPTFILEPRSMLERITDFMSHPHLILHAHLEDDPLRRFLHVVRYYLSGWHIRPKGCKKPYNPVLGEFFRCRWQVPAAVDASGHVCDVGGADGGANGTELPFVSPAGSPSASTTSLPAMLAPGGPGGTEPERPASAPPSHAHLAAGHVAPFCPSCAAHDAAGASTSFYLAEQVSHHPPISAYLYANPSHHTLVSGNFRPKSKFLGNSAASLMHGTSHIYFTNRPGEEYICTNPNIYVRGIFMGTMLLELGDSVSIECPATGLVADIEFKVKGYFTGTYNAISGKVRRVGPGGASTTLYALGGKWTDVMTITPLHASVGGGPRAAPVPFLDVARLPTVPKTVAPEAEQRPYESRALWCGVTAGLLARDYAAATAAKTTLEDRQRALSKRLRARGPEAAGSPAPAPASSRFFYTEDGVRWHFKKDLRGLAPVDVQTVMTRYLDPAHEEPCPALQGGDSPLCLSGGSSAASLVSDLDDSDAGVTFATPEPPRTPSMSSDDGTGAGAKPVPAILVEDTAPRASFVP